MRASAAKRLKKSSSGPNTIDGRMMVAPLCAAKTSRSPSAFDARIMRRRIGVGADGRDVDQRRAGGVCGARHGFGARGLHGIEALAAALEQDADQIDDDIGIAHRRRDRSG